MNFLIFFTYFQTYRLILDIRRGTRLFFKFKKFTSFPLVVNFLNYLKYIQSAPKLLHILNVVLFCIEFYF